MEYFRMEGASENAPVKALLRAGLPAKKIRAVPSQVSSTKKAGHP